MTCDIPEGVGALADMPLGVEEDGCGEGAVLGEDGGGGGEGLVTGCNTSHQERRGWSTYIYKSN